MKAEQRKELQTNSLVRFFGRLKDNFKGGPSRKTTVVWGIILLALVVFVAWKWVAAANARRDSRRWEELAQFTSTEDLSEFVDKNRGTVQAHVAELQLARDDLRDGLDKVYTDPDTARKNLEKAADRYEDLARQFKGTPVLVQECLLGAGKAHEGLGDLDKALGFYRDLEGRFKDSPLAKEAAKRAQDIEDNRPELERLGKEIRRLAELPATPEKDDKKK